MEAWDVLSCLVVGCLLLLFVKMLVVVELVVLVDLVASFLVRQGMLSDAETDLASERI